MAGTITVGELLSDPSSNNKITIGTGTTLDLVGSAGSVTGAGKVLQVVAVTKTDIFTTSSSGETYVDITGLTASITPSSTSSKIYVQVSGRYANTVNGYWVKIKLLRGATQVGFQWGNQNGQASGNGTTCNITLLDSPATTSATTYKCQMTVEGNVGSWNSDGTPASDTGDGTITLMEIGA